MCYGKVWLEQIFNLTACLIQLWELSQRLHVTKKSFGWGGGGKHWSKNKGCRRRASGGKSGNCSTLIQTVCVCVFACAMPASVFVCVSFLSPSLYKQSWVTWHWQEGETRPAMPHWSHCVHNDGNQPNWNTPINSTPPTWDIHLAHLAPALISVIKRTTFWWGSQCAWECRWQLWWGCLNIVDQ